jgi:hypothetical protein
VFTYTRPRSSYRLDFVTPSNLTARTFERYPPLARKMAEDNVGLFREMPTTFIALFLRELITWDWKFPAERDELNRQLTYLKSLSAEQRQALFAPFAKTTLSSALERIDWVNEPGQFSEQLSSHLWATHQIDSFRKAAVEFFDTATRATPEPLPSVPRLGVAIVGKGVEHNSYPLFRKLRPHGTYFQHIRPDGALQIVLEELQRRAAAHSAPYAHWYVDGGLPEQINGPGVTCVSYLALTAVRATLQEKMRGMFESRTGSEAIRSALARMRPQDLGINGDGDPVLTRFEVSILTEGSGTQIFSTTFVQWTSREILRRARPLTLVSRFAPRQRERGMSELLSEARGTPSLDPQGSLIDADMGAYYTWIDLQRLPGSDKSSFLAWFEAGHEAVAIGTSFPRGSSENNAVDMRDVLNRANIS